MKKQFVAIVFQGKENQAAFDDLKRDDRVLFIKEPRKNLKNPFWGFLYKMYFSPKVSKVVRLPFGEKIWGRPLDAIAWDEDTEYYILLTSVTPATDASYLLDMKNSHHIKYITFFDYPLEHRESNAAKRKLNIVFRANVDYVFTSEPKNVVKYHNMISHSLMYSMILSDKPVDIEWDIYVTAAGGGSRLKTFFDVVACAKSSGGGYIADIA